MTVFSSLRHPCTYPQKHEIVLKQTISWWIIDFKPRERAQNTSPPLCEHDWAILTVRNSQNTICFSTLSENLPFRAGGLEETKNRKNGQAMSKKQTMGAANGSNVFPRQFATSYSCGNLSVHAVAHSYDSFQLVTSPVHMAPKTRDCTKTDHILVNNQL